MKRPQQKRTRIGGLFLAVLGAIAILALPSAVAAHGHGHHGEKRHHHHSSGNAGTIASFDADSGKLTITLANDETVSGLVTEDTRVKCGHEDRHGDDSGPGSGPPGQGEDENDDPPGHDGTPPGASEGPGQGADHTADCGPDALVVGATVARAELELENGAATFERVELAG